MSLSEEEYKAREDELTGRKGRAIKEPETGEPTKLSPAEMELMQRKYDRELFGPAMEKRLARKVPGVPDLV